MNNHEAQYLDLVKKVLGSSTRKSTRTGVDTISIFGSTMKFDLRDGSIPMLTTKKMFTRGIIHELLWYIQGSDNIKYLLDNNVHIWDEWAAADGSLNKVYGFQWRHWEVFDWDTRPLIMVAARPTPINVVQLSKDCKYNDDSDSCNSDDQVVKLWMKVIQTKTGYISTDWLTYSTFAREIKELPHFNTWISSPDKMTLSRLYFGSDAYSKSTCAFVCTKDEQRMSLEDQGSIPGEQLTRKAYYVDQIAQLISELKTNPDSRRLIVSAWNVSDIPSMGLPPCHYAFECYTRELSVVERLNLSTTQPPVHTVNVPKWLDEQGIPRRELSMILNQRSCDVGLGVPFNIVQYSILLRMIAHVVGMTTGTFEWRGGDVHIYSNHIYALNQQILREPFNAPTLRFARPVESIEEFQSDDFIIEGYQSHDTIKMDVAV